MIKKLILFLLLAAGLSACTAAISTATTSLPGTTQPATAACTALIEAVKKGDPDAVKICLQQGQDANQTDAQGLSILNYAAFYGNPQVVELLLEAGADVNYRDPWGMSSLHAALKEGHDPAARLLIEHGADVNVKTTAGNYIGFTPLHTAVYFKKAGLEIVKLLLQKGADLYAKNGAGKTALQIAETTGAVEIAALLNQNSTTAETKEGPLAITYTCNDGFIIAANGKKILVDGLIQETRFGCKGTSAEAEAMKLAQLPFDGIDLVLISHGDSDHFAPSIVGSYLQNNPKAVLVTMDAVANTLRTQFPGFDQIQDRVRGVKLADGEQAQMDFDGISLEVISAPADVPNLGFLIRTGGFILFHSGDSGDPPAITSIFQTYKLADKKIDIAFVPWWYIGDKSYREVIETGIQAKDYVPMHFVGRDLPQVTEAVQANYPQAMLFTEEMQVWPYPAPAGGAVPTPAAAAPNGALVFYSMRNGNAEIYTIHADGSGERQLTDNNTNEVTPAWSPDGKRIAFISDREDPHPVKCFPDCLWKIYIMNTDGSNWQQLMDLPGSEGQPSWSPDGTRIAFEADRNEDGKGEIYVIGVDGNNLQQLTDGKADDRSPDWSPDAKQIAFTSTRDGTTDIYVMNADGHNQHRIFDSGMQDYRPDWSPDGTRIAFFSMEWPSSRQDIYFINPDGTNLLQVINTPRVSDENPQWSPDGSQIAFQTDRGGNFDIYIMNADGSNQRLLVAGNSSNYWPAWRP